MKESSEYLEVPRVRSSSRNAKGQYKSIIKLAVTVLVTPNGSRKPLCVESDWGDGEGIKLVKEFTNSYKSQLKPKERVMTNIYTISMEDLEECSSSARVLD